MPMCPFARANIDSVRASMSRSRCVSRTDQGSTAKVGRPLIRAPAARPGRRRRDPLLPGGARRAWPVRSTPTTKPKPPARPAATPASASSKTAASAGWTLSARAAARNVSGAGLPRSCSAAARAASIRTSNRPVETGRLEGGAAVRAGGDDRKAQARVPHRPHVQRRSLECLEPAFADQVEQELVLAVAERDRPWPRRRRFRARRETPGRRRSEAARRRRARSRQPNRTAHDVHRCAGHGRPERRRTSSSRPPRAAVPSASAPRRGRTGTPGCRAASRAGSRTLDLGMSRPVSFPRASRS